MWSCCSARRKFAPTDYWIVRGHYEYREFVAQVCEEERELEENREDEEDEVMPDANDGTEQDFRARFGSLIRSRRNISRKQMALISPRLGLLNNLPMTIPFMTRVKIFNTFKRYVGCGYNNVLCECLLTLYGIYQKRPASIKDI